MNTGFVQIFQGAVFLPRHVRAGDWSNCFRVRCFKNNRMNTGFVQIFQGAVFLPGRQYSELMNLSIPVDDISKLDEMSAECEISRAEVIKRILNKEIEDWNTEEKNSKKADRPFNRNFIRGEPVVNAKDTTNEE